MKKGHTGHTMAKKLLCLSLSLLMAASLLTAAAAAEAEGQSDSAAKNIAIVLDNSGSMYYRGNQAWCRATYAIEVFAAMKNDQDTLSVYPMWDIDVNGVKYSSENPLVIKSREDIQKIRQIYTPSAGATPIETISSASSGLAKGSGEKWLIVISDGDEFYENDQTLGATTGERLSEVLTECNKSVNVMFLGIGGSAVVPEVSGTGKNIYYADKAADSNAILSKLTTMGNNIFGRDELLTEGTDIDFDISMRKLIVFVQGEGVSDITLNSSDGAAVFQGKDSYSPHYAEKGAGGYQEQLGIDRSLQGMMMTYEDLDAGSYTIGYEGNASSVSVYYEPDVDLQLFLLDKNGDAAQTGTAYPGKFTVQTWMVDKNGQKTESALLGKTEYTISYSVNGEEFSASGDQASSVEIELAEGDVVDFGAEVTYLSGYHIVKKGSDMGWPQFTVLPKRIFGYSLEVSAPQKYIVLSKVGEAEPLEARVYINGEPATREQCEKLSLSAEDTDLSFHIERTSDGTGFLLTLDDTQEIASGVHSFTCQLTGLDENDDSVSVSDGGQLTFRPYPQWLIFLVIFLLLVLLAFLVWLYLNTKVLPKKVDTIKTEFNVDGEKVAGNAKCSFSGGGGKRGVLTVRTPKCPNPFAKGSITVEVEAITPRGKGGSASRELHVVTPVVADRAVNSVKLGSVTFIRDSNGKLVRSGAKADTPVDFVIHNGAQCNISGEVLDYNGGTVMMSMTSKLKFS